MDISTQDIPVVVDDLYGDLVGIYHLYFNPVGYGGGVLLDNEAEELLRLCDGTRNVEEITRMVKNEDTLSVLNSLAEKEIIRVSDEYTKDLHRRLMGKPSFSCWLHLTNSCNLACDYCYIHKSPGSMSLEQGKRIIRGLVKDCQKNNIGKLSIKYAGGEPLTKYALLKQLVEYSEDIDTGIKVEHMLLTNGTLLTPEIAVFLKEHHFNVGLSLDGLKEANDRNRRDRKGRGSFDSTVKGMEIIRGYDVPHTILVTVAEPNFRQLPEFTEFILKNEFRFRFSLARDIDTGHPTLLDFQDELIDVLHRCYDLVEENLPKKDINKIHQFCDVVLGRPINRSCGAGSNFVAVGHNDDLGICGLGLSTPFGRLKESTDIVATTRDINADLKQMAASNYSICNPCFWRKSCAGGCPLQSYSTYGRYDMPSPYCEVYQQIIPRILRIKGLQLIRDAKEVENESLV